MIKKYIFIHLILLSITLFISAKINDDVVSLINVLYYFILIPMYFKLNLTPQPVTFFLYVFNFFIIGVFIFLKLIRSKKNINIFIINISIAFAYMFPLFLNYFGKYVGP